MDLRVFEAKALAQALTDRGHAVSERTVQRWKKGVTKPKPQDIPAIRQLLGIKEEALPPWAEGLADLVAERVRRRQPTIDPQFAARVLARLEALVGPPTPQDGDPADDQARTQPPPQSSP